MPKAVCSLAGRGGASSTEAGLTVGSPPPRGLDRHRPDLWAAHPVPAGRHPEKPWAASVCAYWTPGVATACGRCCANWMLGAAIVDRRCGSTGRQRFRTAGHQHRAGALAGVGRCVVAATQVEREIGQDRANREADFGSRCLPGCCWCSRSGDRREWGRRSARRWSANWAAVG
jgi:hypothetical protein